MQNFQDWTTVVFKKKNTQTTSKCQLQPQYQRQLDENDLQNKMFDKEYIQTVIKKRNEKKWNQKQLATSIRVDVHVIQRFEQGKEVYDHGLKSKLNSVLDIKK